MKKNLKVLCLLAGLVLTGCSNATSSSQAPASSSVAPQSSVAASSQTPAASSEEKASSQEQPSSETVSSVEETSVVESSQELTVAYALTGTIDFYGMYSVTADLTLYEGGTGDFTLTYTGTDPFTFNNANWSVNADGTLTVNLTAVTPDGETMDVPTTFYVVENSIFGLYSSNLGTVVISNVADLSYNVGMSGMLDFYGMYSVTIKAEMLSNGIGLYTMDYGASGCMTFPTTWALDADSSKLTFNAVGVDPETSAVTYTPAEIFCSLDSSYYCMKVGTNLGELWVSSTGTSSQLAVLTGTVDLYGMYSVTDTLTMFSDNYALFYQDYGTSGAFGAAYAITAGEEENTFVLKDVYFSEDVTQDITITLTDGVYTATVYSGLGEVSLTSATAVEEAE